MSQDAKTGNAARSSATARLLAKAAELGSGVAAGADGSFNAFERAYRDWVIIHYEGSGTPAERVEKVRLLVCAMLAAPRLGDAVDLMLRFAKVVFGRGAPSYAQDRGEALAFCFERPFRAGAAALLSEIWLLSLYASMLEFLVHGPLDGMSGEVRQPALLPPATAALLFDKPIAFQSPMHALVLPKRHLARAVSATLAEVADFPPPLGAGGLGAPAPKVDTAALVAGLLRAETLRAANSASTLASVAQQLGCSPATLRRRLAHEGVRFREIREAVLDDVAKRWLADLTLTVETIAERLGYSDSFAFRRSFRRRNGRSPTAYRHGLLGGDIG
jgi:AraC-like DNA-binding protein